MKYLITGASGFVGTNLVAKLAESSENELILIKHTYDIILPNKVLAKISIIHYTGEYSSLKEIPSNIDYVIHLATYYVKQHTSPDVDKICSANIKFGMHLLEKMIENNINNFINISSFFEHYINQKGNIGPKDLYAASKSALKDIIKYYTISEYIKSINLEFFDTYGLGDTRGKFIDLVLKSIKENKPFKMSPGEQEIAYANVSDVVKAIIEATKIIAEKPLGFNESYSVFNKEVMTLKNIVSLCFKITGKSIPIDYGFYPYEKNIIMKLRPNYPILPNWKPEITLKEGIKKKWKEINER